MSFRPRRGFPDEMDAALNRRWVTADTPPHHGIGQGARLKQALGGAERILRPGERIFFSRKGSETGIIQDSPGLSHEDQWIPRIFWFLDPGKLRTKMLDWTAGI